MFFYKDNGRVRLDCTGDFILTRNDSIVRADRKHAAPMAVSNVTGVTGVGQFGFIHKLRATFAALRFIWGAGSRGYANGDAVEYNP